MRRGAGGRHPGGAKEWGDHVLSAIIISGRRTGSSVRRSHRADRFRGTGEAIPIQVNAKGHDKRLRARDNGTMNDAETDTMNAELSTGKITLYGR